MKQTSAAELASFLQRQREERARNENVDFPGLAAVLRPHCFKCKKEVDRSEEFVDQNGMHIITVYCHGEKDVCTIPRDILITLQESRKATMSAGLAFKDYFFEEKKKIEHQQGETKC